MLFNGYISELRSEFLIINTFEIKVEITNG